MTTAAVKSSTTSILTLTKADPDAPAFRVDGRNRIFLKAGTVVTVDGSATENGSEKEIILRSEDLVPGKDFNVFMNDDSIPFALPDGDFANGMVAIGGFHYAPGGNAIGRAGGDSEPAINPTSCWDQNFRPSCPDPRGMALVAMPDGARFWVDIYLLAQDHLDHGTSRFGVTIADGDSPPQKIDGKGRTRKLDYATAVEVLARHGKQLPSYDEFRVLAFGVTEKTAASRNPKLTGLDAPRTSQRGVMQATGNLWQWGHDGDPDDRRASLFGGSWIGGNYAGSRCASLGCDWPERSLGQISARGRCDHLNPAA